MHHVIIGGGPAATNAVETIRQLDGGRSAITLVCDEPAHSRMALPYWLAGAIPEVQTHTGDAATFRGSMSRRDSAFAPRPSIRRAGP